MSAQPIALLVAECGVELGLQARLPSLSGQQPLIVQQRATESARTFTQRVAHTLSALSEQGVSVERTGLWVSRTRGTAALRRRLGLARMLIAGANGQPLRLAVGGPLAETQRGRLDIAALADTLSALVGSETQIEMVSAPQDPRDAPRSTLSWSQAA